MKIEIVIGIMGKQVKHVIQHGKGYITNIWNKGGILSII